MTLDADTSGITTAFTCTEANCDVTLYSSARLAAKSDGAILMLILSKLKLQERMKLIREEIETVEFLVETRNGKKSMYIEGVFLQGNIKNRNGRMYPTETLRKEVFGIMRIMFNQEEHLENWVILIPQL